jgi:hypothetical protein
MAGGKRIPWMLWLLPVVFCVLVGLVLYQYQRSSAMAEWPSTDGQVSAVRVEERTETRTVHEHGRTRRRDSTVYDTELDYDYELDGTRRVASDAKRFSTRKDAEAEAANYSPGQTVLVFYDPEDHADSVLFKEMTTADDALVAIVGGLLSVVLCFFVFTRLSIGSGRVSTKEARGMAEELAKLVDGRIEEKPGRRGTVWSIEGALEGRELKATFMASSSPFVTFQLGTLDQAYRDVYFVVGFVHDELDEPGSDQERMMFSDRVYFEWGTDDEISAREVIAKVPRDRLEVLTPVATENVFHGVCSPKTFELRIPMGTVPGKDRDSFFRGILSLMTHVITAVESWPPGN